MASLQQNPKVYCLWEHRKWVLETMPDADWGWEIKMVEMYLEKDARNCAFRVFRALRPSPARLTSYCAVSCGSPQLGLPAVPRLLHPRPAFRSLLLSLETSPSTNDRVGTRLHDAQDLCQLQQFQRLALPNEAVDEAVGRERLGT